MPQSVRPTGRQTKLTLLLISDICHLIRLGSFIDPACRACGISRESFYDWKRRGEADIKKGDNDSVFAIFADSLCQAEAESEARGVMALEVLVHGRPEVRDEETGRIIAPAVDAHPQLLAYWLERRFPKRWAKRDTPPDDAKAETTGLTPEERRAEIERLMKKRQG